MRSLLVSRTAVRVRSSALQFGLSKPDTRSEKAIGDGADLQGFAFGRIPVFVEHNSLEATGGHEETFDLER